MLLAIAVSGIFISNRAEAENFSTVDVLSDELAPCLLQCGRIDMPSAEEISALGDDDFDKREAASASLFIRFKRQLQSSQNQYCTLFRAKEYLSTLLNHIDIEIRSRIGRLIDDLESLIHSKYPAGTIDEEDWVLRNESFTSGISSSTNTNEVRRLLTSCLSIAEARSVGCIPTDVFCEERHSNPDIASSPKLYRCSIAATNCSKCREPNSGTSNDCECAKDFYSPITVEKRFYTVKLPNWTATETLCRLDPDPGITMSTPQTMTSVQLDHGVPDLQFSIE